MNISSSGFTSIEQMRDQLRQKGTQINKPYQKDASFGEILVAANEEQKVEGLKFSKHASMRMQSRNIGLTPQQLERLQNATDKARKKGINESLVMVDELAFIVSVKNNTVITAIDEAEEQIFTNIDGAIIT